MGNKHSDGLHRCPYCLKAFGNVNALRQHQARKKHRVKDRKEYGVLEKQMRAYHQERMAAK